MPRDTGRRRHPGKAGLSLCPLEPCIPAAHWLPGNPPRPALGLPCILLVSTPTEAEPGRTCGGRWGDTFLIGPGSYGQLQPPIPLQFWGPTTLILGVQPFQMLSAPLHPSPQPKVAS